MSSEYRLLSYRGKGGSVQAGMLVGDSSYIPSRRYLIKLVDRRYLVRSVGQCLRHLRGRESFAASGFNRASWTGRTSILPYDPKTFITSEPVV